MPRMAVGSWAWVFGPYASHPVPLQQVAREVKAIGFDGLEITGRPHAFPDDFPTFGQRRELARMLADEGIAVASLGGPVGGGSPLVIEPTAYLDSLRKYLAFCVDTGITSLRVSSGRLPANLNVDEAFARLVDVWRPAAELASQFQVRLLWEFEPNQFPSRPHDVNRLARIIDHPNFKVIFDLSHAYVVSVAGTAEPKPSEPLSGGIPAFIRLLKGQIGRLHLADTEGMVGAGGGSLRRQLGEGRVDFRAALAALRETRDGDDWWTLDLHGEADATATAHQAKAFMDALAREAC
jgi:sugar phosphate isomerase/epimerase